MCKALLCPLFICALLCGCKDKKNEYCVESLNGVPFLHMKGKPTRGRMFYGNVPGAKYSAVDAEQKKLFLEFTPARDTDMGRVLLNFGATISDVFISKISLAKNGGKEVSLYDFSAADYDKRFVHNWTKKSLEAWRDFCETTTDTPPDLEGRF